MRLAGDLAAWVVVGGDKGRRWQVQCEAASEVGGTAY
jgi:hypothetical protein